MIPGWKPPRASGNPPRMCTSAKHARKTLSESSLRTSDAEDRLVNWYAKNGRDLAVLTSIAAQSLRRLDRELADLPVGVDVWGWPIFEDERRMVEELKDKHPVDSDGAQRVASRRMHKNEDHIHLNTVWSATKTTHRRNGHDRQRGFFR
jgi:hypothetical protein